MIVMPANSSGWFWHCLARETGRIGHLYSPGAQRGPWPWFPYALDCGTFALWNPAEDTFDEAKWRESGLVAWRQLLFWAQSAPANPRWAIVPDRPGNSIDTVIKWNLYAGEVQDAGFTPAIAVQNGMTPEMVADLSPRPRVICVGGTTEWKWNTVEEWRKSFKRVHLLRCNSPGKLQFLDELGIESCDGTGWNRGNRVQTEGLEQWARDSAIPFESPLWPHVCREAKDRKQTTFA